MNERPREATEVHTRLLKCALEAALEVLHAWPHMSPDMRRAICHWHLQLADPLYRGFTGTYLVNRRAGPRAEVTRDLVVGWVGQQGPDRWTMSNARLGRYVSGAGLQHR